MATKFPTLKQLMRSKPKAFKPKEKNTAGCWDKMVDCLNQIMAHRRKLVDFYKKLVKANEIEKTKSSTDALVNFHREIVCDFDSYFKGYVLGMCMAGIEAEIVTAGFTDGPLTLPLYRVSLEGHWR